MSDEMGTFRTMVELEHHVDRGRLVAVRDVLVDTGAEATWIPREVLEELGVEVERTQRYRMADGRVLTRDIGFVIVHVAGRMTTDEVVFAHDTDLTILGARSMEGLNLRVNPRMKQLEDAGPVDAAAAA